MSMRNERDRWVTDRSMALVTDLYELTMLQAYWAGDMLEEAVFSLFVRDLPAERNFLLAAGLDDALHYLENVAFDGDAIAFLADRTELDPGFLDWLAGFRFSGEVRAVPEGTPVFANEPILEVAAPLPEAQLVETFVMNQIHLQTTLASKAARVVSAAAGRDVIDFGLRRIHGVDAGLKAARAFHIAGVAGTSNVLAGRAYGVSLSGTMAHSYIQAHADELQAFRDFARSFPETVLLVDTYDTAEGVRRVVRLAEELGDDFRVRGVRLDSGDLGALAFEARSILDAAGLHGVRIIASGGLDEGQVAALVASGAPIDAFGVGTRMGVSSDAPTLDMAYKLTEYAGEGRMKLSTGKVSLPGRKQVFRLEEEGRATRDVIARADEELPGRPLLRTVMRGGRRLPEGRVELDAARAEAHRALAAMPERLLRLEPADPPYPVEVSRALSRDMEVLSARVQREAGAAGAASG
jgi:nicotinate phosphoribosyltransferase